MRKLPKSKFPARRGLSLLEIVVCVVCLLLLLALGLPWLLTARDTSREKLCLTRMKAITDAVVAYTDNTAEHLPYLAEEDGWPVAISPYWDLPGAVRDGAVVPEEELKKLSVPQLSCPADPRTGEEKGALSYVMNAGYGLFPVDPETQAVSETGTHRADIDLDGDGEVTDREWSVNYATGVIWRPDTRPAGEAFRMSLPYISANDGTKFTLLLSENLNAGHWLSEETMDLAFAIGRERFTFAEGPESQVPLRFDSLDLGPFAINAILGTQPGHCPAPSSLHGDYVHVMYCDGRGEPLSAKIDPRAYAYLLSSNGTEYGQAGDPAAAF